MWNHRNLDDPIQKRVEELIHSRVPKYSYGTRREDQVEIIESSPFFGKVSKLSAQVVHDVRVDDYIEAWRSHATLQRQAGDEFLSIVDAIELVLKPSAVIQIPYTTQVFYAQKNQ